jgi:DNA adenine methylase
MVQGAEVMRYVGSKGRHAKDIVPILESHWSDHKFYIEPFVGGGNLFCKVSLPNKIGFDADKYPIALLKAIRDGWVPPENISEEEYYSVKSNKDSFADHYVAFVGFCCSFSGKFFGGYARDRNNTNYAAVGSRSLLRQSCGLSGANLAVRRYEEMGYIPSKSLIYCDPPYKGTQGYTNSIDHEHFWSWCRGLVKGGHTVFVSEYEAPNYAKVVWSKSVGSTLDHKNRGKTNTEKLFMVGV